MSGATTRAAFKWLQAGLQKDGSLRLYKGDPGYVLSADMLLMAAAALGQSRPDATRQWLLKEALDPENGGMRDIAKKDNPKFSNVAGFTLIALLETPAF